MDEPQEIREAADAAVLNLLPSKSRKLYDQAYNRFREWCSQRKVQTYSENVMLAYFSEKAKVFKASTIWAQYSMIRACVQLNDNIDISKYGKLIALLKRNSDGYQAKKSKILTREQIETFLSNADDREYLMVKVALILGIAGACRADKLVNLKVSDIEDLGTALVINIPNTKNKIPRTFVVTTDTDGKMDMVVLCRKYASLRPPHTAHGRFFLFYKGGKCTVQPVGKNTFGKIPSMIATYLDLPNPTSYTGHSLRRSSATLLADAGTDVTTIKRHGDWKSTTVAEGYIENSIENKTRIANQVPTTSRSKYYHYYQQNQNN